MKLPRRGPRRRALLRDAGSLVLMLGAGELAFGAAIVAVRVWPAADYTRVTIESDTALAAKHFLADNPQRLVVDVDGLELSPELRELVGKVRGDDPFIAGVRVGQNRPRLVRLVIDLKQAVAPQVFSLEPVAAYRHRLVFDLHPTTERDPLLALIQEADESRRKLEDGARAGVAAGSVGAAGAGAAGVMGGAGSATRADQAASAVADALGEFIGQVGQRPAGGAPAGAPTSAARPPARPPSSSKASSTVAGATSPGNPAASAPPSLPPSPTGRAPAAPARATDRLIVVALDPGHGGEDPGAIGPTGLQEKDVVLAVALLLRDRLQAEPGLRVMLTRDADFFVPLHERVRKARRVQADLFVSIHADAFVRPQARGASVFALSESGATSVEARWMAERENASDLVGGVNLRSRDATVTRTLLDMSTTAQIKDSLRVGSELLGHLGQVGRLHKPRVEQAGFAVLKAPDVPSILVETAFISNPDEEALLRDTAYRARLVEALATGILRYFARNPPLARTRAL